MKWEEARIDNDKKAFFNNLFFIKLSDLLLGTIFPIVFIKTWWVKSRHDKGDGSYCLPSLGSALRFATGTIGTVPFVTAALVRIAQFWL